MVQLHVETPPIPFIKSKNGGKLYKDCVKIKMRRDPTSEKLDLHEFKISLFDNGDMEMFFFFISNFQMTLEDSGTLVAGTNIQYICMLVHGEALHQIYMFSAEVVSTTSENRKSVILGLGTYIFPVNALSKTIARCAAK